jgi:magnesium transporter
MGDRIEILEEQLTEKPNPAVIKNIHALKREMIYLRKSIWPLREVISGLHHRINGLIESDTILYLKDIYDHTIQVIDTIETYRDFLAGMLEVYLSAISNRLNEVMKVLTVFASIFIPLTFITSLYGMNFDTSSAFNMPELHWHYGYLYVWGIILLIVVGMMIFFKRKKWW